MKDQNINTITIIDEYLSLDNLKEAFSKITPEFSIREAKSNYKHYVHDKGRFDLSFLSDGITKRTITYIDLIRVYQCYIFNYITKVKSRLFDKLANVFEEIYLYPALINTWNKIKNIKIDYFEEHPLKDCFEIAFLNFIKEHETYSEIFQKKLKHNLYKLEKNIYFDINSGVFTVSDVKNYDTENFFDFLFSASFISVLKYCLFKYFTAIIKVNNISIMNKYVSEINGFHISNSIALNKFSTNIMEKFDELNITFDSDMKSISNALIFYNQCHVDTESLDDIDFVMPITMLNNEIKAIISPSKHDSIDTFIDERILENYEKSISNEFIQIRNMFDTYAVNYLEHGLQDGELLEKLRNEWTSYMSEVIDSITFDKSDISFEIKFSNKELNIDDMISNILNNDYKKKYGDNYTTLLTDTTNLFRTFYMNCIKIYSIYNNYMQEILKYVRKLIDNSIIEANYYLIGDLSDYILKDNRNVSSIRSIIRQGTIIKLYA